VADRGLPSALAHDLVKQAVALVVEPVDQHGRDRGTPEREPREPVQHVRGGAAHEGPSRSGDPPDVEVESAVATDEQWKARQPVRPPAERGVEFRRGVEARLVGLEDPQQSVAVERPLALDELVVAHDRRHLGGVPDRDPPRPRE
jgi:hypothetical protein